MDKNLYFLIILLLIFLLYEEVLSTEDIQSKTILKIKDSNLYPIKNKKVILLSCDKVLSVFTDNTGSIILSNMTQGKYIVIIPSENTISLTNSLFICNNTQTYSFVVKENIYSEISGTIYESKSNIPVTQSIVILFKKDLLSNRYFPYKKTTTNHQGKYSFKYLLYGDYFIKCVK